MGVDFSGTHYGGIELVGELPSLLIRSHHIYFVVIKAPLLAHVANHYFSFIAKGATPSCE